MTFVRHEAGDEWDVEHVTNLVDSAAIDLFQQGHNSRFLTTAIGTIEQQMGEVIRLGLAGERLTDRGHIHTKLFKLVANLLW